MYPIIFFFLLAPSACRLAKFSSLLEFGFLEETGGLQKILSLWNRYTQRTEEKVS